jgi:Ca2+-transporting ATPase
MARRAFDSTTRMMATVHRSGADFLTAVKGAPEAVLHVSTRLASPDADVPLSEQQREFWRGKIEQLGQQGLRVIAVAERTDPAISDEPYHDLTLLGLVGLYDPPRPDVPASIAACRRAGIRVIMVTGDHAVTAASIAKSISLVEGAPHVIEGRELQQREVPPSELLAIDVFARVNPGEKLALVTAYQAAGAVVAMTGDGVNDAPALKKADIGVAMGLRGTEVARQAAAMVLRDDSFSTIVAAVREGRVIFANIRRFITYLLSCNLSEVMVVGIAIAIGLPLPLLPLQILFLNLVTDVFPAFALAMGEGSDEVMRQPPRDPKEPIISARQWVEIVGHGFVMTAATLFAMQLALNWPGLEGAAAVTVSFLTLALTQIWHVFNMVEPRQSVLVSEVTRNPYVWGSIAICIGLLAAACYAPPLTAALRIEAPELGSLAIVLAASLLSVLLGRMLANALTAIWNRS